MGTMEAKKEQINNKPEVKGGNGKNGNGKKKLPIKGVMIQMHFDFQRLIWLAVVFLMLLSLFELWSTGKKQQRKYKYPR